MRTPDVNVLLYAVNRDCAQHDIAKRWIAESFARPQGVGFSWIARLGFLRLATRSGIFAKPLNAEEALLTGCLICTTRPSLSRFKWRQQCWASGWF